MAESGMKPASRWKRLGGALVDILIGMALIVPILLVTGVFDQIMAGQELTIGQNVFFIVLGLSLFLAVNGYLLATQGQSVGKMCVGTRIVGLEDGRILPLQKVFGLRYLPFSLVAHVPLVGHLIGLADALFIFRKDKRCIHDLVAGTTVVEA